MKKYITIFVSLLVLLFVASSVLAEDGNTTTNQRPAFNALLKTEREAFRAKMLAEQQEFANKLKTEREAFRAEVEKSKADFKAANAARKAEFLGHAQEMISKRFEMAITALERIQGKVGEAIDKLDADGKDTTAATDALDLSKQKLDDAKAKLAEIKGLLPDSGEKITADIFAQVKTKAREAKDLLKESRNNLVQAIKEVGSLRGEENEEGDE